jgi:hypothetical protein
MENLIVNPKKYIGEKFQFSGINKRFKLLQVSENGFIFYFNKNFWCTNNMFIHMIILKTNQSIRTEQLQTEINF